MCIAGSVVWTKIWFFSPAHRINENNCPSSLIFSGNTFILFIFKMPFRNRKSVNPVVSYELWKVPSFFWTTLYTNKGKYFFSYHILYNSAAYQVPAIVSPSSSSSMVYRGTVRSCVLWCDTFYPSNNCGMIWQTEFSFFTTCTRSPIFRLTLGVGSSGYSDSLTACWFL